MRKMLLKIIMLPLILILTPVNLLSKLLLNVSEIVGGVVTLLLVISLIICIQNHDLRSSVMSVIFISAGIIAVLAVGFIDILIEDAMGAMLKYMVS